MDYRNATPFPSLAFEALDAQSQAFHVVVARMTLDIQADGSLKVSPEQSPLVMADEFYGDMTTSVRQESDLAPYKPWCDVIVNGDAFAPGRKALPRFEAGVRISRKGNPIVDKRVTVMGPRYWKKRLTGWTLSEPEPIQSLPLRYEYAYGGECRIEANEPAAKRVKKKYRLSPEQIAQHPAGLENAPIAHTCCEANPIGKGYAEAWFLNAKKIKRLPAPQLESPQDSITKFGKSYTPQGLGVIGRAWISRNKVCGTMDEAFIKSGRPLPEDFDFAYWNGAYSDLQVPWLAGDETIDLINILVHDRYADRADSQGNRITRLTLPGHHLCAEVIYPDRRMAGLDFKLDTLVIHADQKKINLGYRLKLPVIPEIQSFEVQYLSTQERDILMDHVEAVNQQVLRYQEVQS